MHTVLKPTQLKSFQKALVNKSPVSINLTREQIKNAPLDVMQGILNKPQLSSFNKAKLLGKGLKINFSKKSITQYKKKDVGGNLGDDILHGLKEGFSSIAKMFGIQLPKDNLQPDDIALLLSKMPIDQLATMLSNFEHQPKDLITKKLTEVMDVYNIHAPAQPAQAGTGIDVLPDNIADTEVVKRKRGRPSKKKE